MLEIKLINAPQTTFYWSTPCTFGIPHRWQIGVEEGGDDETVYLLWPTSSTGGLHWLAHTLKNEKQYHKIIMITYIDINKW